MLSLSCRFKILPRVRRSGRGALYGSEELSGVDASRTGDEVEGPEEDLPVFGICNRLSERLGTGVILPMQILLAGCEGRVSKDGMGKGRFPVGRCVRNQEVETLLSVRQGSPAMSERGVNVTKEHLGSGGMEVVPHSAPMEC